MRKKSEVQEGKEKIFYRQVKDGKVTYEFNATYRKPSDSGWVSEIERPKSKINRDRSKSEVDEEPKEKIDIFDVTSAKLIGDKLQV